MYVGAADRCSRRVHQASFGLNPLDDSELFVWRFWGFRWSVLRFWQNSVLGHCVLLEGVAILLHFWQFCHISDDFRVFVYLMIISWIFAWSCLNMADSFVSLGVSKLSEMSNFTTFRWVWLWTVSDMTARAFPYEVDYNPISSFRQKVTLFGDFGVQQWCLKVVFSVFHEITVNYHEKQSKIGRLTQLRQNTEKHLKLTR